MTDMIYFRGSLLGALVLVIAVVLVFAIIGARVSKSRALGALTAGLVSAVLFGLLLVRFAGFYYTPDRNRGGGRYYPPPAYRQQTQPQVSNAQVPPDQVINQIQAQAIRQAIESAPMPETPQTPGSPLLIDQGVSATAPSPQSAVRARGAAVVTQQSKQWANDWEAFVSSTPAGKRFAKSASDGAWATEAEARIDARRRIPNVVLPFLENQITSQWHIPLNRINVNQLVTVSMDNALVADEFLTREEHNYGTTWKCVLLLDVSDRNLNSLGAQYMSLSQTQRVQGLTTWSSMAGVVLAILLAYGFLNFATRGYYVWRLRTAAIALAIVGLMAVALILGIA